MTGYEVVGLRSLVLYPCLITYSPVRVQSRNVIRAQSGEAVKSTWPVGPWKRLRVRDLGLLPIILGCHDCCLDVRSLWRSWCF